MSSYYDDEPRRYSNVRTRPRERGEPDYVVEETYIERGNGPGPRGPPPGRGELVYRGRDDSVEDIPRDFPPPRGSAVSGRGDYQRRSSYRSEYEDDRYSRRAKSTGGRSRYDDGYDDRDRYSDYGTAAAAGAAGYAAGRHRERDRSRRRRGRDDYSDYSSRSRSRTPPKKERRKSGIEEVLGGLGLGGVVGALAGKKDRDRSRSDSRSRVTGRSGRSRSRAASRRRRGSSTSSSSRSRSRGGGKKDTEKKWAQAAQAAIVAGAVEAFRSRKEPGPWTGDRGKRIATAAIGAGGIDGLLDRNPNEKSKRHLAEAVLGGLAANRLANGPRSKSRGRAVSGSPDGRSPDARAPTGLRARSRSVIDRFRGRSQSRGRPGSDAGERDGGGGGANALKGLAAGGALAAAGKAIYDRVRSKSRKRDSRSRSSSADSYVPSRRRRRDRRGSPQSDTGSTRQSRAGGTGQSRDLASRDTNNGNGALVGAGAGAGAGALATRGSQANDDASSDSSSTTDMEKKRKHMRGKELLTAGLATIATIHAAHGVYSSMEAHEKRHKLVAEGEMTPEEARKKQTKAWVQDAAAVGIAALGIKGAFSEWKEMNEQRREIQEIEKRKAQRRKKREMRQKREEQERWDKIMQMAQHNPQAAMAMGGGAGGGMPMFNMPMPQQSYQQPQPDQSGNPYAGYGGGGDRR